MKQYEVEVKGIAPLLMNRFAAESEPEVKGTKRTGEHFRPRYGRFIVTAFKEA